MTDLTLSGEDVILNTPAAVKWFNKRNPDNHGCRHELGDAFWARTPSWREAAKVAGLTLEVKR